MRTKSSGIRGVILGFLIITAIFWVLPARSSGVEVQLILEHWGTKNNLTEIYSSNLRNEFDASFLITRITLIDDAFAVGGAPGIFSGCDVDALFLDRDGDPRTMDDRILPTSFSFSAGSTRFTDNPIFLPNDAHPGPTFGSLNQTTIDFPTATLNMVDAVYDNLQGVNTAYGVICLGDRGLLTAYFSPGIPVGNSLYFFFGEMGTGVNAEFAVVVANAEVVPLPPSLLFMVTGLLGLAARSWCLRRP